MQTYTAVYYVFADLVMLSLYSYYKLKHRMAESEFSLFLLSFNSPNTARYSCFPL